uniref:Thymidylate kinase n=1 Tax=Octopus bimaculoides TaxID=37653 RepID=A0A0L8G043_OCTBM
MMSFDPPELHRGQLFVFEGIDRCGKSTQCENLKSALEGVGRTVVLYSFPNRDTAIGSVIDKYLKKEIDLPDQAIHLLFTANRWETMKDIQKMLLNGVTVIMDRYAYSGICYSVAKGTLSLLWCKAPDRGIIKPDCIFFLDLSPLKANRRAGFGEERYEVIEFQEKVRDQFLKIKDNSWKKCRSLKVDGTGGRGKLRRQETNPYEGDD